MIPSIALDLALLFKKSTCRFSIYIKNEVIFAHNPYILRVEHFA